LRRNPDGAIAFPNARKDFAPRRTASSGCRPARFSRGDVNERQRAMTERKAILYRMVLPDHVCPHGVRAKELLDEHGFETDDRLLRTREEVDAFKDRHEVATTPQVFVDEERIGGADDLERWLEEA
jgi:glutaredoxin 3